MASPATALKEPVVDNMFHAPPQLIQSIDDLLSRVAQAHRCDVDQCRGKLLFEVGELTKEIGKLRAQLYEETVANGLLGGELAGATQIQRIDSGATSASGSGGTEGFNEFSEELEVEDIQEEGQIKCEKTDGLEAEGENDLVCEMFADVSVPLQNLDPPRLSRDSKVVRKSVLKGSRSDVQSDGDHKRGKRGSCVQFIEPVGDRFISVVPTPSPARNVEVADNSALSSDPGPSLSLALPGTGLDPHETASLTHDHSLSEGTINSLPAGVPQRAPWSVSVDRSFLDEGSLPGCALDQGEVCPTIRMNPANQLSLTATEATSCLRSRSSFLSSCLDSHREDDDDFRPRASKTVQIITRPEEHDYDDDDVEEIELLPIWKQKRRKGRASQTNGRSISELSGWVDHPAALKRSRTNEKDNNLSVEELGGAGSRLVTLLAKFVLSPESSKRLAWDVLGMLLIGYDLIFIPMMVFGDEARTDVSKIMEWAATIFWTFDIPSSFLVGFHSEGVVVMHVETIARHYVKTWFPLDFAVIVIDWALSMKTAITGDSGASSVSYMRFGKFFKFLRLLRLLRVVKAHGVINDIIERIQSERCLILIGILRLLVFIMIINHIIACAWYAVGDMQGEDGWHVQKWPESAHYTYKYVTSLHWSITQFTPASMEVVPCNPAERSFAVLVIIFAMVTFSSFVSTITNAMTQLRNLNRERHDQSAILRRYFNENKISASLIGRISACTLKAMGRSKRRVHECEVVMLQLLPWNLRTELQEEVFSPIIGAHPFFRLYADQYKAQMKQIYQNAVAEVSVDIGKETFNSGATASMMYFVLSGVMSYKEHGGLEQLSMVTSGKWLTEAVLWVTWKHTGQLIATTHCELISLNATKVQEVLVQTLVVKCYAQLFVRFFKKNPDLLTDIFSDIGLLQEMALRAFNGELDDGPKKSAMSSTIFEDDHTKIPKLTDWRSLIGGGPSPQKDTGACGPSGRRLSIQRGGGLPGLSSKVGGRRQSQMVQDPSLLEKLGVLRATIGESSDESSPSETSDESESASETESEASNQIGQARTVENATVDNAYPSARSSIESINMGKAHGSSSRKSSNMNSKRSSLDIMPSSSMDSLGDAKRKLSNDRAFRSSLVSSQRSSR
mmetsp:Transcript_82928/g.231265  ORF Transcript_82928/g.231265 Transcript_82928/m.231265 type:complete len:1129 (-) Transcript_82928:75-3461(-)